MNVWQNTTLGDGDVSEKLIQLFIVADGKLEVTRNDTCLLVIASGITGQLEDFSREVFQNSSEVNGSTWWD